MSIFRARGSPVRPAASTSLLALVPLLLALGLVMAGCSNPRASNTPPLDAYALSGGKIKHFTPMPGLSNAPGDAMLLAAVGLSHLRGSVARSGSVTFQTSNGNDLVGCLIIDNAVLISLDDLVRQGFGRVQLAETQGSLVTVYGPPYNGKPFVETRQGEMYLYQGAPQYIQITPGSNVAIVGGKHILLHHPILWQKGADLLGGNHIILLSDALRLFREHDRQMGSGQSVRNVKIIYDLRDYHR